MSPAAFRGPTSSPRRLLTGIDGAPPDPPRRIAADAVAVAEWFDLWRLDVAAAWRPEDHGMVARLAMLRAGARSGSRNASVQQSAERALMLTPLARRHAGVAVPGDVLADGSAAAADAVGSAFVDEDEDAGGVVVFDRHGQVLEQFGRLTDVGRQVLSGVRS